MQYHSLSSLLLFVTCQAGQIEKRRPWPYDEKPGRTIINFVLTKENLSKQVELLLEQEVVEVRLAGENFIGEEKPLEKGTINVIGKGEIADIKQAFLDSKEYKVTGSTRWALRCTVDWILKSKKEIRWIFYSFEFRNSGWSESMYSVMKKYQIKADK